MKVNIIAAIAKNGVIGDQGKIPWYITEDLKRFKELTTGHAVVMGRRTWQSLPVKPLPNRENFVICSSLNYNLIDGDNFITRSSVLSALNTCYVLLNKNQEVFIIGGSRIYQEALNLRCANTMYITNIHYEYNGDTYFPNVDWSQWKEVERKDFEGYSFVKYDNINHAQILIM